jgi:phosphonate transport system permease protein
LISRCFDFWIDPQRLIFGLDENQSHKLGLGTLLAIVMAVPVGIMGANNIVRIPLFNWLAKLILVSSRSVNSLVWALLFVANFGPGPLAGTVCIGFRSVGLVGKLFAEALEEVNPGPVEALSSAGALLYF